MNKKDEVFFQALGSRGALARKEKHLTQTQLAEHPGIARKSIFSRLK
jgi:DNA-binding XRE family transcriptional regulator